MTYVNPRDPHSSMLQLSPELLRFTGGCYCKKISYTIQLVSKEEARATVCHCKDCKKTFGSVFGVTVKVPTASVRMTGGMVMVRCVLQFGGGGFREKGRLMAAGAQVG